MEKTINQTQVLYTSSDYVEALKKADKIEKAVSLLESGNKIKDFPLFIKAYNELLEQVIATNDSASNNPNMQTAHFKLMKKLGGLDKRATAASAEMKIAPPSKELIQMLKVDDAPPQQKKATQWTWI